MALVGCSRESSGCQRCKKEDVTCSYSRSGIIRRNRKRKTLEPIPRHQHTDIRTQNPQNDLRAPPEAGTGGGPGTSTHQRLQRLIGRDHHSLQALASLLEENSAIWQDSSAFDILAEEPTFEYLIFDSQQTRTWVDDFIVTLEDERLLFTSAPPEVLDALATSRPDHVQDRAWLIMFYSVALASLSSANSCHDPLKRDLKRNLWLSFNDARFLLVPSAASIQALMFMACYAEEYMAPSVCWSLINKACTMLQALGVNSWRIDAATRELRSLVFWRLNVLDKAMSLILGRPPAFHREIEGSIGIPTLEKLHRPANGLPSLFQAHYKFQIFRYSRIMSDTWHCLYGTEAEEAPNVNERLETWHREATQVLEAAALAEKPLLNPDAAASVDQSLKTLHFHAYSLQVLLTISCRELRPKSMVATLKMLKLLPQFVSMERKGEPFGCLLWQRIHFPLTAFGSLWGDTLVKGRDNIGLGKKSLDAIQTVPAYFGRLQARHTLAKRLQDTTETFIKHCKSILYEESPRTGTPTAMASDAPRSSNRDGQSPCQPMELLAPGPSTGPADPLTTLNTDDESLEDILEWSDSSLFDATFDWFAWSGQSFV